METFFDTHLHVWDPVTLDLPWLASDSPLRRPFTSGAFRIEGAQLGITDAVYMEVDTTPELHSTELELVQALLDRSDSIVRSAVLGARPDAPDFRSWIDRLREDRRIVGIREVLHTDEKPRGRCLEEDFAKGIRAAGRKGLLFEACVRSDELEDVAELARLCPRTKIVLDHHGNPDVQGGVTDAWRRGIDAVAAQKNTIGKMSGLIQHMSKPDWTTAMFTPFMSHLVDAFGADRIVWGSNWPVCLLAGDLGPWVETTNEVLATRTPEERTAIMHGTAQRVYGVRS